jgi:hypothetical protein
MRGSPSRVSPSRASSTHLSCFTYTSRCTPDLSLSPEFIVDHLLPTAHNYLLTRFARPVSISRNTSLNIPKPRLHSTHWQTTARTSNKHPSPRPFPAIRRTYRPTSQS